MIEIDGGYLEGGGQILRTATTLAAATKKPCRVFNIRKSRPKPGLATQHLLALQALSQLCGGILEGDFLGSEDIKFYPGDNYKEHIFINIPTAGSITLLLQTLILPAFFSKKTVKISIGGGATDTFFSPTIDYFRYAFLKILEKMAGKVDIDIVKRGYYPEGGAKVEVKILPSKPAPHRPDAVGTGAGLKRLCLTDRGPFKKILVISGASEPLKDKKVAERQIAGAKEVLGSLKLPLEEKIEYYPTQCPGRQICLVAEFENTVLGIDNLGKLGKRAEDVGKEAALELLKEQKSEACLDRHLADQILPYLVLSSGKSRVTVSEITNHCKTNIWTIEKFVGGRFQIKNNLISWNPAS